MSTVLAKGSTVPMGECGVRAARRVADFKEPQAEAWWVFPLHTIPICLKVLGSPALSFGKTHACELLRCNVWKI